MDSGLPGHPAPATDRNVDVEGVDLDPTADAARPLRRHQGRAAAEERVEDDVATDRAIEERVGDQPDRLHGRVQLIETSLLARLREGRRARIVPDVGPVPAVLAEFDV